MSDRLKDNELTKVAEHFCEHPLMKSCQRAFRRYQAQMQPLLFAPEEVFCEAAIIIDHIFELPQTNEVQTYIASLWDELRIKMSKWEKTVSPQNLDMAVSAVLYTVAIAMSRHWATFYNFDVTQWLLQAIIQNMKVDHQEMVRVFNDLLEEGDGIEDWINDNFDGHLKSEITAVLKGDQLFIHAVVVPQKANTIITRLHQMMEGKQKPKDVMMPVRAAMDAGVIRRPTEDEFYQEFGKNKVKAKSSISQYTDPTKTPYKDADFEAMKSVFIKIKEE